MTTISGAIAPPAWWVALLAARIKVGAGKGEPPPGMVQQSEAIAEMSAALGREYTAPEMSRALKGLRIPIQLACDLSEVLSIPSPVYVATGEEEARRMEQQRDVSRTIVAAQIGRLHGQLADTVAGVEKSAKSRQTGVLTKIRGEEAPGGGRGESGRGVAAGGPKDPVSQS